VKFNYLETYLILYLEEDIMSINPTQLRHLIVDVLKTAGMFSEDAVELLMMTAAQETHCGKYIEQVRGPALGIFQMEPFTHDDIYKSYIKERPSIMEIMDAFTFKPPYWSDHIKDLNQRANIPYQIVMARVFYMRFREKLPPRHDVHAMAKYYKKYWNSYLGKATEEEAIDNYRKYA
jgi:hypothetical protein